jgi:hypothetical protein
MNKSPNSQLELIKKSFGIEDWDSLLSSSNRHVTILSKAIPPMTQRKRWYEGGSPDWVLVENLLRGSMRDIWPNPSAIEIKVSERLNDFNYEYLELYGWSYKHDVWLSRYEKFLDAVSTNTLKPTNTY